MLRWAVVFAILALVAAVLGFGGLGGDFAYTVLWDNSLNLIRSFRPPRQKRP